MNWRLLAPAVLAALLMGAASVAGEWAQPTLKFADRHHRAALSTVLPDSFEGWRVDKSADVVSLPPDVAEQIKTIYTEVADRVYVNAAGQRIMLTLAYGKDQSDGFKVHRPEVCYAAQGFTVSPPAQAQLNLGGRQIDVQHVDTSKGDRFEPVTYWMVVGDTVVNTPFRHKVRQIEYAFQGVIADGMLVRVSSFSHAPDRAYEEQAAFVRQWLKHVPPDQRSRLFGI